MSKVLVAFFSATGTTGMAATSLAKSIGADLYEIVPEVAYTNYDLDWRNEQSRSSVEMKDKMNSRPAIGGEPVKDMAQYDTIFVAYPIWWYTAPTIINSFLESYDLSGKNIVLFATSGSTGFGSSVEDLEGSARGAYIREGSMLNGISSEDELKKIAEKFL
ncbi:MAG: flavodoxin [Lachnospiraceae bacterium]|nr:flavodoxin [Lachnospiraceae bacterium]MBQ9609403.1 flavodoxin [Lachnospiraceae bacterium]